MSKLGSFASSVSAFVVMALAGIVGVPATATADNIGVLRKTMSAMST